MPQTARHRTLEPYAVFSGWMLVLLGVMFMVYNAMQNHLTAAQLKVNVVRVVPFCAVLVSLVAAGCTQN